MIKLFEEYNQYYTEITSDEYFSVDTVDKTDNFTDKEMDEIVKFLGRKNYNTKNLTWYATDDIPLIEIIKLKDEWFLVYNTYDDDTPKQRMYKCDQFEGLMKLLDKIKDSVY